MLTQEKIEGTFYGIYMNYPSKKHDDWSEEKQRKREALKMAGPSVQEIVKNKLDVVEVENSSLCNHIFSLYCSMIV